MARRGHEHHSAFSTNQHLRWLWVALALQLLVKFSVMFRAERNHTLLLKEEDVIPTLCPTLASPCPEDSSSTCAPLSESL